MGAQACHAPTASSKEHGPQQSASPSAALPSCTHSAASQTRALSQGCGQSPQQPRWKRRDQRQRLAQT